jgi:hypothetical protein
MGVAHHSSVMCSKGIVAQYVRRKGGNSRRSHRTYPRVVCRRHLAGLFTGRKPVPELKLR